MESLYNFIAGWCGGCAGVIVGQPLDTVKVRMQAMTGLSATMNTRTCITGIIKNETVFGLFKGMAPPLATLAFQNALIFSVHSTVLQQFQSRPDGSYTTSQISLGGSIAGLAQIALICPVDLVKIKLQMQTEKGTARSIYQGPVDCLRKIYKSRGIAGCYQGMTVCIIRDVPGFAVYFGVYELLCDWFSEMFGSRGVCTFLLSGGLAGVISWSSTFPFDVIKSRIQADGNLGKFKYSGLVDCTVQSYRSEGLRVFTRGLWPTILRAFPSNAAIFSVHGTVMGLFRGRPDFSTETLAV